eukprot:GHVS01106619.1.p1 GENE.GHVS01106619.1~~GHVS01106619.1.p1  ORF type:complete len:259 (-),score=75.34 GHVS01106619.1:1608-2384(-)
MSSSRHHILTPSHHLFSRGCYPTTAASSGSSQQQQQQQEHVPHNIYCSSCCCHIDRSAICPFHHNTDVDAHLLPTITTAIASAAGTLTTGQALHVAVTTGAVVRGGRTVVAMDRQLIRPRLAVIRSKPVSSGGAGGGGVVLSGVGNAGGGPAAVGVATMGGMIGGCSSSDRVVVGRKRKRAASRLDTRQVLRCVMCGCVEIGGYKYGDYVQCSSCGNSDFRVVREWLKGKDGVGRGGGVMRGGGGSGGRVVTSSSEEE